MIYVDKILTSFLKDSPTILEQFWWYYEAFYWNLFKIKKLQFPDQNKGEKILNERGGELYKKKYSIYIKYLMYSDL
jgi:hypothetical protein